MSGSPCCTRSTEAQAREALARLPSLGLPNLFMPRRDHLIQVDALPTLGTGKLDLRGLRQLAEQRLGVSAESGLQTVGTSS